MRRKFWFTAIWVLVSSWAFALRQSPGATDGNGLVKSLTSKLGVTEAQASGGAAAVLGLAKHRMGDSDFGKLTASHPEVGSLLENAGASNIASLLDVTKQFKQLGLDVGLVQKFIPAITDYFGDKGGDAASGLLKSVLSRKEN
jgi:Protein of unknown function VcgC/VcgE (DUF2780)